MRQHLEYGMSACSPNLVADINYFFCAAFKLGLHVFLFSGAKTKKIGKMWIENVMEITFIRLFVNVCKFMFCIASWKLERLIAQ